MTTTVAHFVTPHLLRVVDLAKSAQQGSNVDFHVRDSVGKTMAQLTGQFNAEVLVSAYLEGLENLASQGPSNQAAYQRALQIAVETARALRRD